MFRAKNSTADKSTNESQGSERKSIPEFALARPEGASKRRNTISSMKTPSSKPDKGRKSISWSDNLRIEIPE